MRIAENISTIFFGESFFKTDKQLKFSRQKKFPGRRFLIFKMSYFIGFYKDIYSPNQHHPCSSYCIILRFLRPNIRCYLAKKAGKYKNAATRFLKFKNFDYFINYLYYFSTFLLFSTSFCISTLVPSESLEIISWAFSGPYFCIKFSI